MNVKKLVFIKFNFQKAEMKKNSDLLLNKFKSCRTGRF